MAPQESDPRLSFQESMDLLELPSGDSDKGTVKKYMGTRAAWLPGSDLPFLSGLAGLGKPFAKVKHGAAFGGNVYSQGALATCRALAEEEEKKGLANNERLGLHTIHGYFTAVGQIDRPFIYTVSPLSASRTFSTYTVTAHQPAAQSANPSGDPFPASDAAALPAGPPCFTAITSFKQPEPHSGGASVAEESAQSRFSQLLASRPARDWPPAPPIDIDGVVAMAGADVVGTFPVVDMRKVDMAAHNEGRPLHERRELLLYRLLKPLPADGTDGWDANAHVLVHAFEADRNGLLMLGNHLGFGFRFGRAASLSYSFVVHVNVEEAVMRYEDPRWWVQEVSFPRASAGRGVVMSKIWSPDGVHVATEYQDGLCRTINDGKGEARAQKL